MGGEDFRPSRPGAFPFRPHFGRAVTGDRRLNILPGQSAQLIDAEYDIPGFFFVQGVAGVGAGEWRCTFGVDRATFRTKVHPGDSFAFVVSARSISLSYFNYAGALAVADVASAMIIPIDMSDLDSLAQFFNRAYLDQELLPGVAGLRPSIAIAPVFFAPTITTAGVATNVASVAIGDTQGSGLTVYNNSTANLYLRISGVAGQAASIASGGFTVRLVPQAYYEIPFTTENMRQFVTGIWDAADPSGYANVTSYLWV